MKIILFFFLLCCNLFANDVFGDFLNFNMYGRVRGEGFNDFHFTSEQGNYNYTGSKFRLNVESGKAVSNKWKIVFTPQFVKYFGLQEYVPSSASTNTAFPTSGFFTDTRLDVHQAFIDYRPVESLDIKVGRQIISYGDELILGAVEWTNTGRAFDALKFEYSYESGHTDLFFSKLVDQELNREGISDYYYTAIYSANDFGRFFRNTDFYLMYKRDEINNGELLNSGALGARVKSKEEQWDHRVEATMENVKNKQGDFNGEYQFDIELGYELNSISTRLSIEYFQASKFYDQFFPTAHKFLGFADQFGRRNIKGLVFGARPKLSETIRARVDFHLFRRTDNSQPVYALNGKTPYKDTSKSGSYDVANELDLVFYWDTDKGINLEVGICSVNPSSYMDSLQNEKGDFRNQDVTFGYLAMEAKF